MGELRKQYSREFKQEAVRLVTENGLSIAQAARDLGIRENMLARWKKELESQGQQAFPGQGRAHEDELVRLRQEVEVLRREHEILKKPWVSSRNTCPEIRLHSRASVPVSRGVDVSRSGDEPQCLLRLALASQE